MKNISISNLLEDTFTQYKNIIGYGILSMSLYLTVYIYASHLIENQFNINGIIENLIPKLSKLTDAKDRILLIYQTYNQLIKNPDFFKYLSYNFLLEMIIFPSFVGLIYLPFKFEQKLKIDLKDILIGFQGNNFFKFLIVFLLYKFIQIIGLIFVLPYFYFSTVLILVVPFILFKNLSIFEAFKSSIKIINKYWFIVFLFIFILKVLATLGLLFFTIGALFTFPILHVGIYVLYRELVGFNK